MNENTFVFPSNFKGSVYNGQQRWHGDRGRFISKKLASEMILHFMTLEPSPDIAEQVSDIPPENTPFNGQDTPDIFIENAESSITKEDTGAQIYDMNEWRSKTRTNQEDPDDHDGPYVALQVVGINSDRWINSKISPNHPARWLPEMIRRNSFTTPLHSPRAAIRGNGNDNDLLRSLGYEPIHIYDEDQHIEDYAVVKDVEIDPHVVRGEERGFVSPDSINRQTIFVPPDEMIDRSTEIREVDSSAVAVVAEKKKRGGKVLAALLGALLVGAIWYAVERNDSDDVRGDSLHLTVPVTTSTTEKTTLVASTPTTVLETSTTIPVENIPATTIVVETPLVPKPVPVVPTTIVINSPAEATVPATNEVVEPAVIIVDVPPIDPVIIAPVTETPMAAPELNTANLASFNPAKWPYENAVKVGAQKPGEYVQHVLDEYNARYGRQFIWNHQNGMFYEGKHIINRSELNSYYDIFKELSDHETAGLPITA